jgi:hypothetical protein
MKNMTRLERDKFVAWVGYPDSDIGIWGQYERLVDFIFEEYPQTKRRFDEISLPTLFTLSHAIELALKENIKFFAEYHESKHLTKFDNWAHLIKSHDLEDLSEEFKIAFNRLHKKVKADTETKKEFNKYFQYLKEINEILKRNTETYRYSVKLDNEGKLLKQSIPKEKKIDFLNLKELFEKVKILFFGAPNSLGIYTDYIDFKRGNPDYEKGKGYLYKQRLNYTEHSLENMIKPDLDKQLRRTGNDTWIDEKTGEIFEIQIWENDVYIISI